MTYLYPNLWKDSTTLGACEQYVTPNEWNKIVDDAYRTSLHYKEGHEKQYFLNNYAQKVHFWGSKGKWDNREAKSFKDHLVTHINAKKTTEANLKAEEAKATQKLHEEISHLRNEFSVVNKKLSETDAQLVKYQTELSTVKQESAKLNSTIEAETAEKRALEAEVRRLVTALTKNEGNMQGLINELGVVNNSLTAKDQKIQQMATLLNQTDQRNEYLISVVLSHENDINQLRQNQTNTNLALIELLRRAGQI